MLRSIEAGAVSVLRWHALSGYSLALTQYTGGRVTIVGGTRALLDAIAAAAPFERRLVTEVAAVTRRWRSGGGRDTRRRPAFAPGR